MEGIYNASKTGTSAFRKAIQNDLAQNNIKIIDVCHGLIQTEFYKRANNELLYWIIGEKVC